MKKIFFRIFIGVGFTSLLMLVSVVWAQAASSESVGEPSDLDCESCHPAFHSAWEFSAHGLAVVDPSFKHAWKDKGEPKECLECHTTGYDPETETWIADGVTCEACHSPIPRLHPNVPMPVTRSADLCGHCHTDTYFEWQVSIHGQENLDCVSCHGQHSTNLKGEDPSALCASCHGTRASNFTHTEHYLEGLSCADCHLGVTEGDISEGRGKRDHDFNVSLDTCVECHDYLVHSPEEVHVTELPEENLEVVTSADMAKVSSEPAYVSPIGFASLSGLIGLAIGMIAAPWLERWFKRMNRE